VEANDKDQAGEDFAAAVRRYNDGDHRAAADEFMAFFEKWPRHPAADNALYMAGLGLSAAGDCAAALPWFSRVEREFPAGDAVPAAILEEGRCRARLKESGPARAAFEKLRKEFPGTTEAEQARVALERMR
jgi:TolA-binding protein